MENYVPSDQEELIDARPPFPAVYTCETMKIMTINQNTKFGHIIDYVNKYFSEEANRHVIFRGVGDAADKCISCVEVYKRKSKETLYQWNKLATARRVTYWDPIIDGMDRLKVTVDTPVMFILLSRDPYPVELQCLSMQSSKDKSGGFAFASGKSSQSQKRKKPALKKSDQNKWARGDKSNAASEAAERREIRNQISRDQAGTSKA